MTTINQLVRKGRESRSTKQKTAALLTGFITTPNENPLGAVKADDGAWTASLPRGVRDSMKSNEKKALPRGYEERLKKYFESLD